MASRLSCFATATKPRDMTITIPPVIPHPEPGSTHKSPTLSLTFDHEEAESPDSQKLLTDAEMARLLSGAEPHVLPTTISVEDDDIFMDDPSAHVEQLTLAEFLREQPPPIQFPVSTHSADDLQSKRRGLISRVKTITALPKAPTNANLTTIASNSQTSSSVSDSTAIPNSRKRKNMSLSSPFGSFKRVLDNSRTNINLGFYRSNEPEFEPVTTSTFDVRPGKIKIPNNVKDASQIYKRSYPGAPVLMDLPLVPSLHTHSNSALGTFRLPPSRTELNAFICQLQSQISDIRLENQVLRDQITIVRKDWIDASQALDASRHETWSKETERYSLAVEVEKLKDEIRWLKRGSTLD